jgi:hypothetical protein
MYMYVLINVARTAVRIYEYLEPEWTDGRYYYLLASEARLWLCSQSIWVVLLPSRQWHGKLSGNVVLIKLRLNTISVTM